MGRGQKGKGEVDAPIIYTVTIVKKDVIDASFAKKLAVMVTDEVSSLPSVLKIP